MARNQQHGDTEAEGTQAPDLDPNLVMNQAREEGENGSVEGAPDAIGEQDLSMMKASIRGLNCNFSGIRGLNCH
jgi:hypothetical protein